MSTNPTRIATMIDMIVEYLRKDPPILFVLDRQAQAGEMDAIVAGLSKHGVTAILMPRSLPKREATAWLTKQLRANTQVVLVERSIVDSLNLNLRGWSVMIGDVQEESEQAATVHSLPTLPVKPTSTGFVLADEGHHGKASMRPASAAFNNMLLEMVRREVVKMTGTLGHGGTTSTSRRAPGSTQTSDTTDKRRR